MEWMQSCGVSIGSLTCLSPFYLFFFRLLLVDSASLVDFPNLSRSFGISSSPDIERSWLRLHYCNFSQFALFISLVLALLVLRDTQLMARTWSLISRCTLYRVLTSSIKFIIIVPSFIFSLAGIFACFAEGYFNFLTVISLCYRGSYYLKFFC